MNHGIREEKGSLIVSFEGELDLDSSPAARVVLLDCVGRLCDVIVDLSRVAYMDSSGVASLVEAHQLSKSNGKLFSLASVSPRALRVLRLARLDKVFAIHENVAEGLGGG